MQNDFQESQPKQSTQTLLPTFSANVKVTDPEADAVKGFYTYLVSGSDELGTFQIRRRYNDFFYFRQALTKKWPGIYIPPIPEKKIAVLKSLKKGNKDVENIELRKKFFDYFMKRIGKIKHLFMCPITRQFLRNKGVEMQKFAASMQAPKYNELMTRYKEVYEKLDLSNKNSHESKANIQTFATFLKKAQKQLQGLKSQMEVIVEARSGFTQNLNNCNTTLLPEYQKNIYSEYLPEQKKKEANLIFVHNEKVQDSIKALKDASIINSFGVCLDHVSYQILQVKAMEEALKIKEQYQSMHKDKQGQLIDKQTELAKLNSGKTTLKSFFSRGSKNEQIQKLEVQIPELEKDITVLQEFNNLVTIIFGVAQIPIFKKNKQIQYYRMMYQVSENEIKYLASYGEFMKSVMQGLNK